MFLDYDGTLSPIVDDPDNALMSDDVRILLIICWMFNMFFLFYLLPFGVCIFKLRTVFRCVLQ